MIKYTLRLCKNIKLIKRILKTFRESLTDTNSQCTLQRFVHEMKQSGLKGRQLSTVTKVTVTRVYRTKTSTSS